MCINKSHRGDEVATLLGLWGWSLNCDRLIALLAQLFYAISNNR
jgi:hypothetical protein